MNSKESVKENPEDIAFKNDLINRLSTLESDYNTRREKIDKENRPTAILKKRLGKGATEISGLQSLQGFESGLGRPTKLNTQKNK